MKKTEVVCLAIIQNKKGGFLLTLRSDPDYPQAHNKWQIPGGGLKYGEHPEETTLREAKEEVGIDITITRLLPKIFQHTERKFWQGIFISYVCTPNNLNIVINDEATNFGWFSKEQIKQMDTEGKLLGETYEVISQV